jgi:hypothetical protein
MLIRYPALEVRNQDLIHDPWVASGRADGDERSGSLGWKPLDAHAQPLGDMHAPEMRDAWGGAVGRVSGLTSITVAKHKWHLN